MSQLTPFTTALMLCIALVVPRSGAAAEPLPPMQEALEVASEGGTLSNPDVLIGFVERCAGMRSNMAETHLRVMKQRDKEPNTDYVNSLKKKLSIEVSAAAALRKIAGEEADDAWQNAKDSAVEFTRYYAGVPITVDGRTVRFENATKDEMVGELTACNRLYRGVVAMLGLEDLAAPGN